MNTFHYPGQEHQQQKPPRVPATPATAASTVKRVSAYDLERRELAVKLALEHESHMSGYMTPDNFMHMVHTLERYLATGTPTVYNGLEPQTGNGSTAVKRA